MGLRLRRTLLTLSGIIFLLSVQITASHGQSPNYYYDDLNRLIRVENPDGTIIGYTYDEVGNRVGQGTPPSAATPVSASGSIATPNPTYTWDAVLGVTMYCLKVEDSTGTKVQQCYTPAQAGCPENTGTCSVTPGIALAAGAGRWWIATYNLGGCGPWSAPMDFSVDPPPAATLVSPTGSITTKQATYTWNAVSGSTWYYLWVNQFYGNKVAAWYSATDADCPNGTGPCSVTPSADIEPGAAHWWIQTYNIDGHGPWSAGMDFHAPFNAYTKSLLHFNGNDGSTTFIDESGKVWTASGGAKLATAQKKFGSASGYFPGKPSYISTPGNVDFQFGAGNFTIDFWIRTAATNGFIISNLDGGNLYNSPTIMFGQNGSKIDWYPAYDGSHKITSKANINDGQWHHIAAVRNGTTFTLYVDGVHQGGEIVGWNPTINGTNQILLIGRDGAGGWYWSGYIDELRISKGIARWTLDFTPPSAEYSAPPAITTASPPGGVYGTPSR